MSRIIVRSETFQTTLVYSESVAINATCRLVDEIPEVKVLLPVYSSKLLVAADFTIKFFFKYLALGVEPLYCVLRYLSLIHCNLNLSCSWIL